MNKQDAQIFSLFAASVRKRFPDARIWAFGSRVKDTATKGSDLDVCVVLERLNEKVDQGVRNIAWNVGFDHDILISTVMYSREEFERGPCSQSSLVHTILEDGVAA